MDARLWIYDLRTNQHFTLKTNPLTRAHLDDFVSCYRADDRTQRVESERFRRFTHDELTQRDKANLDIFWLRDESLEDSENLPPPDQIAEEIMEDLRAALEQTGGDNGGSGRGHDRRRTMTLRRRLRAHHPRPADPGLTPVLPPTPCRCQRAGWNGGGHRCCNRTPRHSMWRSSQA